ncbi:MAG: PEPxxWA-CTERM sorting domain-containing protein [Phenylobacterium sp.]
MSFGKLLAGAAAFALVSAALPAAAAVTITYSDRASFSAAAGPLTTETFESCAGNSQVNNALSASHPGPCGSIVAGVRFAPPPGGQDYVAPPGQTGNPTIAFGVNSPPYEALTVDFTGSNTVAFGADLFQNSGAGGQTPGLAPYEVRVRFLGGDPDTVFSFGVASGGTFFGFTSDTAIDSLGITRLDGYPIIDNASFTPSNAVPEPASWALMLMGFGGLGALLRRRRMVARLA